MVKIRKAEIKDVEEIVDVMYRTWRTTYSDIVNEKYLSEREGKREVRISKMKDAINKQDIEAIKTYHCVVLDNGKVIGFAVYGRYREEDAYSLKNAGEIYAIYILKEYQGKGIGKKLVNYVVTDLISEYYEKVVIWALKDNPSTNFYKKIGGDRRFTKNIEMGEQIVEEVGVVYDEINKLFECTKFHQMEAQLNE